MKVALLQEYLDKAFETYHKKGFIAHDPISIPHSFSVKQDIEIMGFFAAILAWGQRKTIIAKCKTIAELFDHRPYDFILNHQDTDLASLTSFVHRTFNGTDLLYVVHFLQQVYREYDSLEKAFFPVPTSSFNAVEEGLNNFKFKFVASEWCPVRTRKHIASPAQGSACKRLNMFLRWMVRKDLEGIDFGIWTHIQPAQLKCPLDVHVLRVAMQLGLLNDSKSHWQNVLKLTDALRKFDAADPVKYDFALFGIGEAGAL